MGKVSFWLQAFGVLALIAPAWRGIRAVITFLGDIDFLVSRSNDPGWLSGVTKFVVDLPDEALLVLIVLGLSFIYLSTRIRQATQVASPSGPVSGLEYVGASITPQYLINLGGELTHIQGAKLTQDYIGKWIRVVGALRDVTSHFKEIVSVSIQDEEQVTTIALFDNSWSERLRILRRGDKIQVIGQIFQIDRQNLCLENCRLADPDTK